MTGRELFLQLQNAENEDADYIGAIMAAPETELIAEQVICGYFKNCRVDEMDCAECQRRWLDEEYL